MELVDREFDRNQKSFPSWQNLTDKSVIDTLKQNYTREKIEGIVNSEKNKEGYEKTVIFLSRLAQL